MTARFVIAPAPTPGHTSFDRMWAELTPIGRHATTGGYRRFAWTSQDATLREWFAGEASRRGLDLVTDRVGNLWAWRGDPDAGAASGTPGLVLGSHLDSVPDGGAFDGPLGVVSAFAALDQLDAAGFAPNRPLGIACFGDEEGARFGVACAGSRLLTGAMTPERGLALTDADGTTMAEAMRAAGHDPSAVGRDDETLRRVGTFIELHVEQGRALGDPGHPAEGAVAVGSSIWPHGRWRFDLTGRADHAGTTKLEDRDDPMLAVAAVIQQARAAAQHFGCVATVGKLRVLPNGVNAIPSLVQTWLDARGADERAVRNAVSHLSSAVGRAAIEESWTDATDFDTALVRRLAGLLDAPVLATGAGHDAGILATAGVPTAMLFVRNPTGISHSPEEHAESTDCHAGVDALVRVVESLAGEDE
ncbi:MAG: allantoate amidohydrolase [Micropruina sp.]|uniref:allantoate amidohydrolase n=1 Tax=Micropruina sp. TaxID=2737536 RepID=UPI0039E246D5